MDSVKTPMSLRALINMHRWASSDIKSFRAIVSRHTSRRRETHRFLCMNTYLMDVDWPINQKKPAIEFRAKEFGEVIKKNHDIALLQEVFEDNVKDKILRAWPRNRQPFVAEDATTSTKDSSGLAIISQKNKLDNRVLYEFDNREWPDTMAEKGILCATIDIGLGESKLELYNTHLNASGQAARRLQLLELMSFIDRSRDKKNVAIVAGDFNLSAKSTDIAYTKKLTLSGGGGLDLGDFANVATAVLTLGQIDHPADVVDDFDHIDNKFKKFIDEKITDSEHTNGAFRNGMTEHQALVELMGFIGFKDMWTSRNGTEGLTENVQHKHIRDQICKPDKNDPELCDDLDSKLTNGESQRLDYIFISKADDNHSFSVDFTRPRRVRYERALNAEHREDEVIIIKNPQGPDFPHTIKGIDILSDHLGLSTTLLFSPANT